MDLGGKDSHCSYCGQAFEPDQAWPRLCGACGHLTFRNPIPVAVVLLPVDDGVLVIRRGIEPHLGKLALPGGFIDFGESWQEACARELYEETGIRIDPGEVREFRVRSADRNTILIFGLVQSRAKQDLPAFQPTNETTERVVLRAPRELAFPLHTEAAVAFFETR